MMNSILVTYASRFGSTAEVASTITETLRESGYGVDCRPMAEIDSIDGYEAVLVGSAVNYGKWIPEARDFVRDHQEALGRVPLALFTVHIRNIGDDPQSKRERLAYLDEIRPYVDPVAEGFFAGKFTRQGAKDLMPRWATYFVPTIDLRKWDKIRAWARGLPALLEVQPAAYHHA